MFLTKLDIKNFRGLVELSLSFDETTVLIGDNNTGKSTILAAIQICLNRTLNKRGGTFVEYDYHLKDKDGQPIDAAPIEITLTFSESNQGKWSDEIIQMLNGVTGIGHDNLQSIILRVTSRYDDATKNFTISVDFLNPQQQLLRGIPSNALRNLQRLVPTFYLAALRDARREFRSGSQFWGPFVRALKIDPVLRLRIENDLADLNKQVLDAHTAFDAVRQRLGKTAGLVPLGGGNDPVVIEAIPGKVFDMLSRTQVMLSGKTGAHLPLAQHGEGTQSLAVICLFDAFLEAQLAGEYAADSKPILALEEPEAHLHPSAVRAVGTLLQGFDGQKIIATHSGDLLASVPLTALRRLCRVKGAIKVHQVTPSSLSADELRRLDHHVRRHRGHFLFSRLWLLVEGETDEFIFQEAARIQDCDLFSAGVCCFKFTELTVSHFIKRADQLAIDWIVVSDSDPEGQTYADAAKAHLGMRKEADFIRRIPHGGRYGNIPLCRRIWGCLRSHYVRAKVTGKSDQSAKGHDWLLGVCCQTAGQARQT
jgi:putative ATP-dependent endonuclease of the OLD family